VAVDIPIEIPDRAKARPLPAPVPVSKVQGAATEPAQPAAKASQAHAATASPPSTPAAVAAKPASNTVAKVEPAAKPAEPAKAEPAKPAPVAKKDDGDRAAALLDGKAAAAEGRFVVQVGAFSDPAKVRDTRAKVEKAGMKTYTQVADSDKLTRVRVGPFPTRAEAEKAASRIKELDLQARILTL
jgi:DedD protein